MPSSTRPAQLIKANVELIDKRCQLNQIYSMGWECSTVHRVKTGEYKQNMVWVYCKDYLNDVVYAHVTKRAVNIYGLKYNPAEDPLVDMDRLRVMVRNQTNDKFSEHCWNAVMLLRAFEKKMRFKPTKIRETNLKDTFILESDPRWMHATPLLSLWGCLARMGTFYDGKQEAWEWLSSMVSKTGVNDANYIRSAVQSGTLKYLVENTTKCFNAEMKENYGASTESYIHGYGILWWSGIVGQLQALCSGEGKEAIKKRIMDGLPSYCRDWFWDIPKEPEAKVAAVAAVAV